MKKKFNSRLRNYGSDDSAPPENQNRYKQFEHDGADRDANRSGSYTLQH